MARRNRRQRLGLRNEPRRAARAPRLLARRLRLARAGAEVKRLLPLRRRRRGSRHPLPLRARARAEPDAAPSPARLAEHVLRDVEARAAADQPRGAWRRPARLFRRRRAFAAGLWIFAAAERAGDAQDPDGRALREADVGDARLRTIRG